MRGFGVRLGGLLVALALLGLIAPVADARRHHRRVRPLKAPEFAAQLISTDPIAVLQSGTFSFRLTARHTASVRVQALGIQDGRPVALAEPQTFRIRARRPGSRVVGLHINAAGRRNLSTCYATNITLVVQGRGYGSPGLRTRRHTRVRPQRFGFQCRKGVLVSAPLRPFPGAPGAGLFGVPSGGSSVAGHEFDVSGVGTPLGAGSPRYEVGIGVEAINPCPDGTWKGNDPSACGGGPGAPVYLGGFGFGGGNLGVGPVSTAPPDKLKGRAADGILTSTDPALADASGAHARAIAVSDGRKPFLMADMEVQGWFVADKTPGIGIIDMRHQVEHDLAGISGQQVFIQSDHSHGGADALGVWGGVPTSFMQYMARQTVTAIERAYVNRQPGRLYYASADGRDLLTNQFSNDPNNQSQDSDVRVLQARDDQGHPFATLLNFSAHATVLGGGNHKLTGDWLQAANALLEQRFGGRAVTVVGTVGRTQPERGPTDQQCQGLPADAGSFCRIRSYAAGVVDRAAAALGHAVPIDGPPHVDSHSYLITDPASNALIMGFDFVGDPAGVPLMRSISPPWLTGNILGTVTGTARIGDVLLSSAPGEIYPQIALKVQDTVTGIRHSAGQDGFMTAGLSNDQLGYIIAPFEAYPGPVARSLFTQPLTADVIQGCVKSPNQDTCPTPYPISNDNYFFNVSHTMGERVTCSLLRGADEVMHPGQSGFRDSYSRCGLFANDQARPAGADLTTTGPPTPP